MMLVEDFFMMLFEGEFKLIKLFVIDILDCMKFVFDDEVRFYLCGVCIGLGYCVVIDGYRMFVIEGGGGEG